MNAQRRPYDAVKRGIDIIGAITGLVLLSPVISITALVVRSKLGSPVLFKQERPGVDGRLFTLYKFRSMLNVDQMNGQMTNEQRITTFGRKLRSTSLDELPSLWNVLRGDMSLVGPRPLLDSYLEKYSSEQSRRHEVRPGITGLAQINGRNVLDWESRFILDVKYVDSRSFALDVKILLKTIITAVKREGIASEGHVVGAPFSGNDGRADKAQRATSLDSNNDQRHSRRSNA